MKKNKTIILKDGAKIEILTGTIQAIAGPHPVVIHLDEVELMDYEVWKEAMNKDDKKR